MHRCETKKYQIAVFIFFSLISPVCFAYDFAGGTGEPNDPYQIETAAQLLQIGSDPNLLDKCFILNNDINLDPNVTGIPPFTQAPIAPDTNNSNKDFDGTSFIGIFDGNDYAIFSLVINDNSTGNDFLGLFGQLGHGSIVKNLGIESVNIIGCSGSFYLGGLCASNVGGAISNCFSTGSVSGGGDSAYLGGLCGQNNPGTITNCFSTCSVKNLVVYLGGLCGYNINGYITNCYATGSVTGLYFLGGLCGNNSGGTITHCFSTGSVKGWGTFGGLCGRNSNGVISYCFSNSSVTSDYFSLDQGGLLGNSGQSTISNCFSTGTITGIDGSENLGGLCGYSLEDTISNCFATGFVIGGDDSVRLGGLCGVSWSTISHCYATGPVTGGYDSIQLGGLCGDGSSHYISNSYFLDTAGPDNGLGIPLTDTQMKQQASFVSWDFVNETDNGTEDIWTIKEGVQYPEHVWPLVQYHSWDGVDFADYSFFSSHWLLNDCNDVNDCNSTDLDFSGCVDTNDLDIFTTYWLFAK